MCKSDAKSGALMVFSRFHVSAIIHQMDKKTILKTDLTHQNFLNTTYSQVTLSVVFWQEWLAGGNIF